LHNAKPIYSGPKYKHGFSIARQPVIYKMNDRYRTGRDKNHVIILFDVRINENYGGDNSA
jgi:hypothetical protein